jgi:hypothetical protein
MDEATTKRVWMCWKSVSSKSRGEGVKRLARLMDWTIMEASDILRGCRTEAQFIDRLCTAIAEESGSPCNDCPRYEEGDCVPERCGTFLAFSN